MRTGDNQVTPVEIIIQVAEWASLSRAELVVRRRTARAAETRGVAMYLIRQLVTAGPQNRPLSFPVIGRLFGLHHATAIHWCDQIAARCQAHPEYRVALERLAAQIRNDDEPGCAA